MNNFIDFLKMPFRQPSATEVAARELAQAELSSLEHQSSAEYAQAIVSYQEARIKRLKSFLKARGSQDGNA